MSSFDARLSMDRYRTQQHGGDTSQTSTSQFILPVSVSDTSDPVTPTRQRRPVSIQRAMTAGGGGAVTGGDGGWGSESFAHSPLRSQSHDPQSDDGDGQGPSLARSEQRRRAEERARAATSTGFRPRSVLDDDTAMGVRHSDSDMSARFARALSANTSYVAQSQENLNLSVGMGPGGTGSGMGLGMGMGMGMGAAGTTMGMGTGSGSGIHSAAMSTVSPMHRTFGATGALPSGGMGGLSVDSSMVFAQNSFPPLHIDDDHPSNANTRALANLAMSPAIQQHQLEHVRDSRFLGLFAEGQQQPRMLMPPLPEQTTAIGMLRPADTQLMVISLLGST